MAVNDEFRSKRAQVFSSFNAHIHQLRSTLLPAVNVSFEKNREEDFEDFRLDMKGMLDAVMEELKGLRTNPAELKRYLQEMKQDCSEGQTEILNKLSEVEANVNVSLMDLSDIEQTLNNQISLFMALLKRKVKGKSIILMLYNLTLLISLSLSFSPFSTSSYTSIDAWTPETSLNTFMSMHLNDFNSRISLLFWSRSDIKLKITQTCFLDLTHCRPCCCSIVVISVTIFQWNCE
jgi:hypothetical protein